MNQSSTNYSVDFLTERLAERDTELLRTRLECQRLNQILSNCGDQGGNGPDGGPKAYQQQNRKNLELEKEVEHLRWQLNAVSYNRVYTNEC